MGKKSLIKTNRHFQPKLNTYISSNLSIGTTFRYLFENETNMKRVAIIGTVGVPGRYGGFETLAHQLVLQLSTTFKLKVYCSKKAYKKEERVKYFNGARLHYIPFNANGIQSMIYDFVSIIHALFVADTLILLGVSGGLMVPFVRLFTRKKIIVNIDGLEWRRQKWGRFAKAFLKFSERVAVRWSHADITDNAAIKRYTSIHYKTLSNLIEYGADHTLKVAARKEDYLKYPFINKPYAFKVARIEPENNIHMILQAFSEVNQVLIIVGNWANSDYGVELLKEYSSFNNIYMLDPIYDQRRLDVLRSNCYLYIHGHSAGGTNPSLVEAMYLGLPILSFDCSYNRATTENKSIYFKNSDELIQHIETKQLVELKTLGVRMEEIALRRYTWEVIAKKYRNLVFSFDYNCKKHHIQSKLSKVDREILAKKDLAHLQNTTLYFDEI
jgi:glycosyltransferase involved in cell wall biosynthesis